MKNLHPQSFKQLISYLLLTFFVYPITAMELPEAESEGFSHSYFTAATHSNDKKVEWKEYTFQTGVFLLSAKLKVIKGRLQRREYYANINEEGKISLVYDKNSQVSVLLFNCLQAFYHQKVTVEKKQDAVIAKTSTATLTILQDGNIQFSITNPNNTTDIREASLDHVAKSYLLKFLDALENSIIIYKTEKSDA